jgi:hypothetical protein
VNGWVPIGEAAEASRVDVRAIRQWAASGAIDIEFQGETELVRLDRIRFLCQAWSFPAGRSAAGRSSLRGRLEDAIVASKGVTDLQRIARERIEAPGATSSARRLRG